MGPSHTCSFRALALVTASESPAGVMTAGPFQTGKEAVTQNPHFFQRCRKPSLSPQEFVWFPSGERRKWGTWNTSCQLISDAPRVQKMGVKVRWFRSSASRLRNGQATVRAGVFPRRCRRQLPPSSLRTAHLRNVDGCRRTCTHACLSFPLQQADASVLVYINIGRRLAHSPMNHSWRHFLSEVAQSKFQR